MGLWLTIEDKQCDYSKPLGTIVVNHREHTVWLPLRVVWLWLAIENSVIMEG